jgi:putative glutamine amidotransferase
MNLLLRKIMPAALLAIWLVLSSSVAVNAGKPVIIALTKESKNYTNWIRKYWQDSQFVNLYPLPVDSVASVVSRCSGLVITGGDDVFPGLYGKEVELPRCGEIDRHRDSLEYEAIKIALDEKIPILGICRGLQILNVYLGGTLIIDIPIDLKSTVRHQCDDYLNCFHMAYPSSGRTTLGDICGCDSSLVTTNHHQAIDLLAGELRASAFSSDRVIEAIEWAKPAGKSFLLGVQWHPERMATGNPLSENLAREFLRQASQRNIPPEITKKSR